MPQKYLSIEGVSTLVYHAGPTTLPGVAPDRSRGRTVVCLHDAGGHAGFLAALVAQLSETQSPLAFDQPAHGRSAGLDSLGSIERMVWFTGAFCSLRPWKRWCCARAAHEAISKPSTSTGCCA